MRIRKNASKLPESSYSDEQQEVSPPCQPARSPPTHSANVATNKGDNLTINKRYKATRGSEEICVLNQATTKEDYSENYLEHIPCRGMCNCIALKKLDEELKMDDILKEHISNKHKLINKMKQDVFLEKKVGEDVKMMRTKETKGSNNVKECKEEVAAIVRAQKTTWTSSKSDEVKTLFSSDSANVSKSSNSGVVTSASVPPISNPRKRRMVAYGSLQDYYFF